MACERQDAGRRFRPGGSTATDLPLTNLALSSQKLHEEKGYEERNIESLMKTPTTLPSLKATVAFLSKPETYPDRTTCVESMETHLSWVFLTDDHAYKLKKPFRLPHVDLTSVELRRFNCEEELRLNRQLAPNVYLEVLPITMLPSGLLTLHGGGEVADWLVKMRRLAKEQMLDYRAAGGRVRTSDVNRVIRLLVEFYSQSPSYFEENADAYADRLSQEIESTHNSFRSGSPGLPISQIKSIANALLRFVRSNKVLLRKRVEDRRVRDAHGDLRPEHICLEEPPVIIDCLEFSRDLRMLDTASEISFLALECDYLVQGLGSQFWNAYAQLSGDPIDRRLINFYRASHAFLRARMAIDHLKESVIRNPEKWKPKAQWYLWQAEMALSCKG